MAVSASILDVPTLVSQLMAVERKPIDQLNAKITDTQGKISSFGTLSGLVATLQTALEGLKNSLSGYGVSPADSNAFTASATSTAAPGSYALSISQLAQAQTLAAVGQTSQTAALTSADTTVTFTIGGVSTDVTIAAGASLQDIRAAINAAHLGVTASIINDGDPVSPYRLVLRADETGQSKAVTSISVSGDANLASLLNFGVPGATMTETAPGTNAALTVNGVAISSPSNTISDAIEGVTLTLKNVTSTPVTLTVARDNASVSAAAAKFVDAYNALITQLKSRSAFANGTTPAGVLAGDNTVRQMLDQLRTIFTTPASGGTLAYLAEVGITTQAGGTLKFDSGKLGAALIANFADVANLFNGATGFATRLMNWADEATRPGGLIDQRTQRLNATIRDYNAQIDRLERRMTALKKQYTTTYSNLNMVLSSMNDTSSYLAAQFKTQ